MMAQRTREQQAMALFREGYNCSQSLVLAFSDLLPVDAATISRLSCSFGGGMGRLREVCGAVSGALMVLGLLYGYDGPETGAVKAEHYARVQELAHGFEAKYGSIVCRDLLGLSKRHDDPTPEARTTAYYQRRPCAEQIGYMASLLEAYIAAHPITAANLQTSDELSK